MTAGDTPPNDPAAIAARLKEWILATFLKGAKPGAVKDQTPLLGGDLLDSIGMMELVVHVEETWGIAISAEAVTPESFGTVERLARYIAGRAGSG